MTPQIADSVVASKLALAKTEQMQTSRSTIEMSYLSEPFLLYKRTLNRCSLVILLVSVPVELAEISGAAELLSSRHFRIRHFTSLVDRQAPKRAPQRLLWVPSAQLRHLISLDSASMLVIYVFKIKFTLKTNKQCLLSVMYQLQRLYFPV